MIGKHHHISVPVSMTVVLINLITTQSSISVELYSYCSEINTDRAPLLVEENQHLIYLKIILTGFINISENIFSGKSLIIKVRSYSQHHKFGSVLSAEKSEG